MSVSTTYDRNHYILCIDYVGRMCTQIDRVPLTRPSCSAPSSQKTIVPRLVFKLFVSICATWLKLAPVGERRTLTHHSCYPLHQMQERATLAKSLCRRCVPCSWLIAYWSKTVDRSFDVPRNSLPGSFRSAALIELWKRVGFWCVCIAIASDPPAPTSAQS